MPIVKTAGKIIYFAHVPKCGGSAVEHYLRARFGAVAFLDKNFYALPGSRHWTRSSAQHIPIDILNRLFPVGFFDASFAIVRHPVERLLSEYHYLRDHLRRVDHSESFSSWIAHLDSAIAENPWLYDNHLRPMVDLIPGHATVFQLENGLDQIVAYLDELVGTCDQPLRFERILSRDPSIPKVVPSPADIATIERIYRQDFDTFGYARQTAAAPGRLVSTPVAPWTLAVPVPSPDRDALAARFRASGIACFRDGDITQAHAYLRFALNCAPDDAESHALIANTSLRLGALYLAVDHAAKTLDQQPGNLDALVALAGARLRLKDSKARESIEALAPYEQLGDFRELLRIALLANEGDDEAALFDLAQYLETHLLDVSAGELLTETFRAFRDTADEARFSQFLDGIGVLADKADCVPLEKPEPGQKACVDIIIPVYNAIDDLQVCLASISRWPSAAIGQIILVDDCSSPETAAWLAEYRDRCPDVHLVRNAENLGFTRSVMAGVGQSSAPYMLFLNSDTQVTPHWLDGMLQAMQAGPQTALVGPLSNNGFHQTIRPVPVIGAAPPAEWTPDEMAALVRTITQKVFPRFPLLSGFCLLVHRGAFDRAGGLDCEAFPHGYWEVQDLGLKLIDLGLDSVIADNVYVHHTGGGSIGNKRRQDLTATGLARMYERYSALRVLMAEVVSASDPEVARFRMAWNASDHFAQMGPSLKSQTPSDLPQVRPVVANVCRKTPLASVAGREVCLFVMHCPLGAPLEYTITYLEELKRAGLLVIACLVVEDLSIPVADAVMDLADGVLLRENCGYDFGAWADLLRGFPQVWSAERLYFANDSILGPFQPLGPMIDSIRDRNAGFFALSECTNTSYHAQSYFFGWSQQNFQSDALRRFWESISNEEDKTQVVLKYEYAIAPLSPALSDPSQHFVFGMETLFGCEPSKMSGFNPTHSAWRRMLDLGFPFVKTDLLRDGVAPIDTSGWESICTGYGADTDAMMRHIEGSRINRLSFRKHDQPLTLSHQG
jgi:GT2 family glycosyltransferase